MKKLLFVVAVAGIMTSCKDKKDEKKAEETTTTTPTTVEPTTTTPTTTEPTTTTGTPSFSDPDVAAYVKAYDEYIDIYKKAVDGKDMSKMMELSKMGQDLASKGMAASQKLAGNPEEAKKLADYMTARSAEIVALSKKLTGQ